MTKRRGELELGRLHKTCRVVVDGSKCRVLGEMVAAAKDRTDGVS